MFRLLLFPASLLLLCSVTGVAAGQTATTTVLSATPEIISAGSSVGLSATVQPNAAPGGGKPLLRPSGTITFLDGATPLSSAAIALTPTPYASAAFENTFGPPDPILTSQTLSSTPGELTGDLNGDGVPDILIYSYVNQFSVQTFLVLNAASSRVNDVQSLSFSANAYYPNVTNQPQLLDVNGDGKLDLLSGSQVAYGNGDGTFAQPVPVSFLASGFVASYAIDLNGDGKSDILAVNQIPVDPFTNPFQITMTAFLNQGGGTFTPAATFPIVSSASDAVVNFFPPAFVDLNGDGHPDLITQTQLAGPTQVGVDPVVQLFLNNGDGTFGSAIPVNTTAPPNNDGEADAYGIGSGDVNGDGHQDLILTLGDDAGDLDAIILLGKGDGTFQSPQYLTLQEKSNPIYANGPAVVVQDFNLDGKLDLVFGNGQLAFGNGDGTFTLAPPLFPLLGYGYTATYLSLPLVQFVIPGNLAPSIVFYPQTNTPPLPSVFTPQTSSSAMLSLATFSVGTHSITARYSGDANYAGDTSLAASLEVDPATSVTAATSSANPSFAGQSITLTAKVSSPGPAPTGTVTFALGSTTLATLGTATLSGGSASLTTSSLATVGNQIITVIYNGDASTQASTATISQVVDPAFSLSPSTGDNTLTVKSGQTVSAPVNVTGAPGFSGSVTLACVGLPTNAACSFSPAIVSVSGTAAVPSLVTISTVGSSTVSQLKQSLRIYGLSFAGLIFFLPWRRRRARLFFLMLGPLSLAALALNGCGSGSRTVSAPQVAPGTYLFTITARSGSLQEQTTYGLVVQ